MSKQLRCRSAYREHQCFIIPGDLLLLILQCNRVFSVMTLIVRIRVNAKNHSGNQCATFSTTLLRSLYLGLFLVRYCIVVCICYVMYKVIYDHALLKHN